MNQNSTNTTPVWFDTLNTVYTFVHLSRVWSCFTVHCDDFLLFSGYLSRLVQYGRQSNKSCRFQVTTQINKLFVILTITFLFTWTPTFGRPIVTRYGNRENATKYQLFSMLLALLGSAANPVIYSFRCPRFRQEVIKLLTCCCKRKRQVNRNRIFAAGSFSLKETKKTRAIAEPTSISFRAV